MGRGFEFQSYNRAFKSNFFYMDMRTVLGFAGEFKINFDGAGFNRLRVECRNNNKPRQI